MSNNPTEATLVAVLLLVAWLAVHGSLPLPTSFRTRSLILWTTVVAIVVGATAYCARH